MEYRMYGLVVRSLSDMQKGIQFGHAVVEYELMSRENDDVRNMYNQFARKDKTFIILNGGSTNSSQNNPGTLQKYRDQLEMNGVKTAAFYEPDINDAETAIVFLVDKRVWNKETYPEYSDFNVPFMGYEKWVESIGGPTNEFLRLFLPQFKLA